MLWPYATYYCCPRPPPPPPTHTHTCKWIFWIHYCKCYAENTSVGNRRKEWNVLFNNALNTFYLRLYDVRHMVKDHSDSEKGNQLPPHRLLFRISKGSFICTIPQTWYHIPWPLLHQSWSIGWKREIAQWVHPMKDRSDDPSHHERTLLPRSYISLLLVIDCLVTEFNNLKNENTQNKHSY